MKRIGKGMFTTAYLLPDGTVHLRSRCKVKECAALFGLADSYLFPSIERTALPDEDGYAEYSMQFYPYIRSLKGALNTRAYRLYSLLRKIHANWWLPDDVVQAFDELPDEFEHERGALLEAVYALRSYAYDDVRFEISPRNVRVLPNGDLLLLDCFFMEDL